MGRVAPLLVVLVCAFLMVFASCSLENLSLRRTQAVGEMEETIDISRTPELFPELKQLLLGQTTTTTKATTTSTSTQSTESTTTTTAGGTCPAVDTCTFVSKTAIDTTSTGYDLCEYSGCVYSDRTGGPVDSSFTDDSYRDYFLPFDFPVRGVVFPAGSTLHLVSNGWLNFGTPGTAFSWSASYTNTIAFWWDDHTLTANGRVRRNAFTNADGVRCYFFQYEGFRHYGNSSPYNFRVELCENGFVYTFVEAGPSSPSSASIGSIGEPTSANARRVIDTPFRNEVFVMIPQ